jgi:hypothetical protein
MKRGSGSGQQLRQGHPSPPPGGGRSARVSGPGGGDSASTYTGPLSSAAPRLPHPGLPSAAKNLPLPSPCRGGWPKTSLLVLLGAAALAIASIAAPEKAHAVCSVLGHHPCTPYFGSVLRRHPFTPYSCGVFSGPGCTPEVVFPLNQVPVLKVEGRAGQPEPLDREHPVSRINELGPLLSKCLELPPDDEAQAGMRLTLKLAFKRDGELVADPRFTYTTHDAPEKVKAAYHAAVLDMLKHCTPLPITDSLGGAIAGRPFVVAIKEPRNLKAGDRPDDAGAAQRGEPKP